MCKDHTFRCAGAVHMCDLAVIREVPVDFDVCLHSPCFSTPEGCVTGMSSRTTGMRGRGERDELNVRVEGQSSEQDMMHTIVLIGMLLRRSTQSRLVPRRTTRTSLPTGARNVLARYRVGSSSITPRHGLGPKSGSKLDRGLHTRAVHGDLQATLH